jgi:biotin carboxylase
MKKIAIIGANEFQQPLIVKAKQLGYETHVFAWKEGAVGALDADCFYPISIREKEKILSICRNVHIDGIVSIASDLAVDTVNYIAEKMGLPGNSIESAKCCINKYLMRKKLKKAKIKVPQFARVSKIEDLNIEEFHFPIIVKPTDRSGSRCITKLVNINGLKEAIEKAADVSFEKKAIIEEYFEGEEYSCESISYRGEHKILAITKKYTTGSPYYIETGHMQPADISDSEMNEIEKNIFTALDALGIRNGASHSEFKLKNGQVYIIEIGARMGGDYIGSDLVYLSTGIDFIKMVIDVAIGNELDFTRNKRCEKAYVKFFLTQEDIDNYNEFKKKHGIYRVSSIDYTNLNHVIDSSSRLGYYIYLDKLIDYV